MKALSPTRTIPAPGSLVMLLADACAWQERDVHVIPAGTHALVLKCTVRLPHHRVVLDVLAEGVMTTVFDNEVSEVSEVSDAL